jgi:hypothetical protein
MGISVLKASVPDAAGVPPSARGVLLLLLASLGMGYGQMKTSIKFMLVLLVLVLSAPALPGQTPSTRRVMREKLTHSQRILEAILTSDFALLDRETAALTRVTETAAWQALRSPEYLRQSEAFLTANRALNEAAKNRDLDGAAELYTSLTMSCFACHRHMKDSRIAR